MDFLGVLIISGSGSSEIGRQQRFVRKVNDRLEKRGIATERIVYEHVDWYEPIQSQQEMLLERMIGHPRLKLASKTVRKILIRNTADLINYGGKPNLPEQFYEKAHLLVYNAINDLQGAVGEQAPLIVLASSIGTEIINNYIWDRQHGALQHLYGNTAFERFETLVGLFSFGTSIPIFSGSTSIDDLQPIQFPTPNTQPAIEALATWENYYDRHDPQGFPVGFINEDYELSEVRDIQIEVGNVLRFWNMWTHFNYWKSRKLQKRVSHFILRLFQEL